MLILGMIFFVWPVVAAAAAAAAAPIIIHLIMRTKPRKITFPALRFVKKTHKANISKLRLKHLILLLMRILIILLIALLIARPKLPNFGSLGSVSAKAAVVVIIDNSASMGYQFKGSSLLSKGKMLASKLISRSPESLRRFPPGSRFAILSTDNPLGGFQTNRKYASKLISDMPQSTSARTLPDALARASVLLAKVNDIERKEIYIISDMTDHSWKKALVANLGKNTSITVLNCREGSGTNFSIDHVQLSSNTVPVGSAVALEVAVSSSITSARVEVFFELDGALIDKTSLLINGGKSKIITLARPIQTPREGVIHGKILLKPDDYLTMDNVRYFTIQVLPKPVLAVVRDPATMSKADKTTTHMLNVFSTCKDIQTNITTSDPNRLTSQVLLQSNIVVLSGVSSLTSEQWAEMGKFVNRGGKLWIITSPLLSAQSYNSSQAQQIMPCAIGSLEELSQPQSWEIKQMTHPMVKPFQKSGNGDLSTIQFFKRHVITTVSTEANVVIRYQDAVPAILTRSVGLGKVVFWNFSPTADFSTIVKEIPAYPVLTLRTISLLSSPSDNETSYKLGQLVNIKIPDYLISPTAAIKSPNSLGESPISITGRGKTLPLEATEVGSWSLKLTDAKQTISRGFSVNIDPEESNLKEIDQEKLITALGKNNIIIASNLDELPYSSNSAGATELTLPLLLILLALLIGESFFANRFYKKQSSLIKVHVQ